ncbi:MAG: IS21 family transposase [Planctomycetota bacterium]|nr:IS21 family transposase [Planctomycetota bacterium]
MYTNMERWKEIRRRVLAEDVSKRRICRESGLHFRTLQKILDHPEPPGYRLKEPRAKWKIGPFLLIIDEILKADKSGKVPKKQRHTAQRIFDRLVAENGYEGGYTAVKEAVRAYKRRTAEVFVPLSHPPGWAQVDFGFAEIDLAGERTKIALFVMTFPYSDAFFVCLFPRECTEAFQEGHKRAFEFFGGVPKRISYDNSKIAVAKIEGKRKRKLTAGFLRLQSHYLFTEHFCLVRRPNEKGHVETLVGFARRNFLVPVPRVDLIESHNAQLEECCRADLLRTLRGKDKPKGELLEQEREAMLPLPATRFEAHLVEETRASSLSLVRFDCNDYSVPTACAHHEVTAVGTIDEVRLVVNGRLVARHARCWKKEKTFYEPVHYLALLERKPGALDFARPLDEWDLPPCFDRLRRRLETDGVREYIKVLRLLERATVEQLARAVDQALSIGATSVDAIRLILEHHRQAPIALFSLDGHPHLKDVRVPEINLSAYRGLTEGSR